MNKNRRKELSRISDELFESYGELSSFMDEIPEEQEIAMNRELEDSLNSILSDIESIKDDLEIVKDEEEMALDNLPDSLRYSEKGETMEENVGEMEAIILMIEDVMDEFEYTEKKEEVVFEALYDAVELIKEIANR